MLGVWPLRRQSGRDQNKCAEIKSAPSVAYPVHRKAMLGVWLLRRQSGRDQCIFAIRPASYTTYAVQAFRSRSPDKGTALPGFLV